MKTLSTTNFSFPNQQSVYHGKVRDVYDIGDKLILIATDRISAFDVILPKAIPHKGAVLTQIAKYFLEETKTVCPNWLEATPDVNVSIGEKCTPYKVEVVVRGYLTGHAWRTYAAGGRVLCGVSLPEGMKENEAFSTPIITPTTKAAAGHDEDISREEIIKQQIVSEAEYNQIEKYALALYLKGQEMANARGLILVDTKYEFGKTADGTILLIDEVHTPDSSRYFYLDGYAENLAQNKPQKQLSKEFVRQWLIENGFQGRDGEQVPEMTDAWVQEISERYILLFEKITGTTFTPPQADNIEDRIEQNVLRYLGGR